MATTNSMRDDRVVAIEQKLRKVLRRDDTGSGFIGRVSDEPPRGENGYFTSFELDLLQWGATYGLAFGIARGEDPWESDEEVAERAITAARTVFREDSGPGLGFAERHES